MSEKPNIIETLDIEIISFGLCFCTVCVPEGYSKEQIELGTNLAHPTGISSKWEISDKPNFHSGDPNPCQCQRTESRLHYLMVC